ncbi:ATP-binding cassette domain-containing protein [Campylobacter sp.]|uniref:ATP-binding cassette domain-containing protein n=1 Tax=Campylobacter sp. TaxID=205 RepID=UPI002709BA7C|nr:ATP-binding cassette domain-containing protein [Campylobacter sp.]
MSLVSVRNLSHTFDNLSLFKKTQGKKVLDDISFDIYHGEALGLLGKSGSGKSTIAKILIGLLKPSRGEIKFEGDILKLSNLRQKREFYKCAQIVFQDSLSAVNPNFNVLQVVEEPLIYLSNLSKDERIKRVKSLLERLDISPDFLYKHVKLLSGGQLQRVCMARAMAINPKLIILDEALSSLDLVLQEGILQLLKSLKGEISFLFITHDIRLIRLFCDRVILIDEGKVAEIADAKSKFQSEIGKALEGAILPPFPR